MMNIVMTVKDRPRLTKQCMESLAAHTVGEWNLVVVDDGSGPETRGVLRMFTATRKNVALLRNDTSSGILGQVKNLGVYWAEKFFGRGDWLYMSDNDAYFTSRWDETLRAAFEVWESSYVSPMCASVGVLMGGQNHPYHKPNEDLIWSESRHIQVFHAIAGTSWLMKWRTWDRFGPLNADAPGTCQSEDFAFCARIIDSGGKVAAIWPHVVYDCGITQTDGTKSIGHEAKKKVEGVYYE